MACEIDTERLWLYAAGELSGEKSDALRAHLESCPDCARELSAMHKTIRSLPRAIPLNEAELDRYVRQTMERIEGASEPKPRTALRWAPVATALLLMLSTVSYYQFKKRAKMNEVIANLELLEHLDEVDHD